MVQTVICLKQNIVNGTDGNMDIQRVEPAYNKDNLH